MADRKNEKKPTENIISVELKIPESLYKNIELLATRCKMTVADYCLTLVYHDRDANDIIFNDDFDNLFESEDDVIKRKLEKTLDLHPLAKQDDLN